MSDSELIGIAAGLADGFQPAHNCTAGGVAAALRTDTGNIYTGICIDTACSLGFCAEPAAIAEMLKARESHIQVVVAVDESGEILPPCGRCRELIWQVDSRNSGTRVILTQEETVLLDDLLPHQWQGSSNSAGL